MTATGALDDVEQAAYRGMPSRAPAGSRRALAAAYFERSAMGYARYLHRPEEAAASASLTARSIDHEKYTDVPSVASGPTAACPTWVAVLPRNMDRRPVEHLLPGAVGLR